MSTVKVGSVAKYALLPGIVPRVKALFTSGFGYVAYLMAAIYAMVRLLPANHAYLKSSNIGKFGIRHVIAEAANNLEMSKKNIDQIVIFTLILIGAVLLAIQLVAIAIAIFASVAQAQPIPSMFETINPDKDIAFMLLDQVFGVGSMTTGGDAFFNSCVASAVLCFDGDINAQFPWAFHKALHGLFKFYSSGILIIATLIFLYFVVVVVVETASTGTPFGQRFQNVWVPIRLIMAIGLLIPLNYGYNAGQYITFTAAKLGSGFATNGWLRFNNATGTTTTVAAGSSSGPPVTTVTAGNPFGESENMISKPKAPDGAIFAQMMSVVHGCAFSHFIQHPDVNKVRSGSPAGTGDETAAYPETPAEIREYLDNEYSVQAYLVKSPTAWQLALPDNQAQMSYLNIQTGENNVSPLGRGANYDDALNFYSGGDIIIRFGRRQPVSPSSLKLFTEGEPGGVENTCGEIRIPITDRRPLTTGPTATTYRDEGYLGTVAMQDLYFRLIENHFNSVRQNEFYIDFIGRMILLQNESRNTNPNEVNACWMGCNPSGANGFLPHCVTESETRPPFPECAVDGPTLRWKEEAVELMNTQLAQEFDLVWTAYNAGTTAFVMDGELLERGWGGAGIWFNTVARVNGSFTSAALNVPSLVQYPMIMRAVAADIGTKDNDSTGIEQFNPSASGDNNVNLSEYGGARDGGSAITIAKNMYQIMQYWHEDSATIGGGNKILTGGAIEDGMNIIFGTNGLFAMTDQDNFNVHPLAQLTTLGKGLVESAIRNVTGASLAAALGGVAGVMDKVAGPFAGAMGKFLMSTAFIGLTAGFVLFYVLPFLPFLYFYFAVASWIKTIFEAMVGVPLWALAHLRIDGEGLPGDAAANGYFLIFEIFLRPILTVFGLIAAMAIFTAQVRLLHFIWPMVTANVGGYSGDAVYTITAPSGPPDPADPTAVAPTPPRIQFQRSIIDEFFYTIIYAIIVYALATASFKLIDKIPDNILRWMGQSVSSFGDINQDPTENLTKYAAIGGMTTGREAAQGVQGLAGGLGGAAGQAISSPNPHTR